MPNFLFHYTSCESVQSISASGYLRPGQSGKLYLTEDLYTAGAEAANRLAITGKPVEVVGVVPRERVVGDEGSEYVRSVRLGRALLREGGGREPWVSQVIQSGAIRWLELSAP